MTKTQTLMFTDWIAELLLKAAFSVLQILWELGRLLWSALRLKSGVGRADARLREQQREQRKLEREQRMKEWQAQEEPPTSSPFTVKETDAPASPLPRSSSPFGDTV